MFDRSARRLLVFTFVLAVVSSFGIGCRAAPALPAQPQAASTAAARAASTLTLWHSFTGDKRTTLDQMARDFEKAYPDLHINTVYVGNADDLAKQVIAAVALGTPPDLILSDRRHLAEYAEQGGLLTLDRFAGDPELGLSDDDKQDFFPGTLAQGTFPKLKNKMYGFPFDLEAMVMFYNPEMLKAAEIQQPPATWDEFANQAGSLGQDGNYAWEARPDADAFQAMLASRGSALLTNSEDHAILHERAGFGSMSLLAQMLEGQAAELATSDKKARQAFAQGHAAFLIGWISELDALKAEQKSAGTNFEIGVANLPQLDPQEPYLLTRGALFAIPKISRDRARNAWFFVRWVTGPSESASWVRGADGLPLRASSLNFLARDLPTNSLYRQIARSFNGALPNFVPQPAPPHMDTIERVLLDIWSQMATPKVDVRSVLVEAAARVNMVLAGNP